MKIPKILLFRPNEFYKIFFGCVAIQYCKKHNEAITRVFVGEDNFVYFSTSNELTKTVTVDMVRELFFQYGGESSNEDNLAKAIICISDNSEKLDDISNFFDDNTEIVSSIKKKLFYKYISDEAPYLHQFFDSKITFVSNTTFDDIFDCAFVTNKDLLKCTRLLCLSEQNDIRALWGLYSNKFHGFCFEYSGERILNSLSNERKFVACYDQVTYGKRIMIKQSVKVCLGNSRLKTDLIDALKMFVSCFWKESSWRFQKEHRFLLLKDYFDKDYHSITCEPISFYTYKNPNHKKPTKWSKE